MITTCLLLPRLNMDLATEHHIIPFFIPHQGCPHRCVFCDQRTITGYISKPVPEDVLPVIREYRLRARKRGGVSAASWEAAFYGGSFTCLPLHVQEAYLRQVALARDEGSIEGIRLSTRPDGMSGPALELLKRYGVDTVELGVQSLDDKVLRLSHRGHEAACVCRAVKLLKERRFKVGLQLMPGLPGADADSDLITLRKTIELRPDMVRIYPAVVIRGTKLHDMFLRGEYRPLKLEEAISLCARMLLSFQTEGIPVIRLGLQHNHRLDGGAFVAGPHHPALRQLVESHIRRRLSEAGLKDLRARGGEARFTISPGDESNFRGQNNCNTRFLKEVFSLRSLELNIDANLPADTLRLEWSNRCWEGRTTNLLSRRLL